MARDNNHPWINDLGKSILTQPFFELTDFIKWNEEMGKFYEKVNDTDDERSFVLLLAIIMEFHIDVIIKAFFPGYKEILKRKELTLSLKIDLLKSLKIVPQSIFKLADCIRKIRNEFAHQFEIEKVEDLKIHKKVLITELDILCAKYVNHLVYSKYDTSNYREKYKDIATFVNNALREYEPAIQLIRKELDSDAFLQQVIKKHKIKIYK